MQTLRAFLALGLLLAACSCAAPLQSGGVVVRPGAEARLEVVCRYAGGQKVCAELAAE